MEINNKITILSLIYENKDTLFGRFSEKLTHEIKIKKWKEIAEQLNSLSIYNKDWKYLRDTTWQNFRKRTIEKRDNRQQTGSAGGKKCRYDDVDELVLKIIGKESPVLEGLCVPESSGSDQAQIHEPAAAAINSTINAPEPDKVVCESPVQNTPTQFTRPPIRKRYNSVTINETNESQAYIELKTKKMELELRLTNEKLEIAKRERYKLDLELLKLERELNIQQPSPFTLPFYLQNVVVESTSPIVISSATETDQAKGADILSVAINNSFL
ncbi:uncharacterized protein LOC125226616 [Leguminivora glycinivorella]|uniref:uncharacterized protein LOC125226616 n=1 Tax=Leguminivora glycinivorella TaxID=1035111 RepID=UPI00200D81B3|nr:uncharacterized protein LOC125226616 [Leguminivora glycinivorella]